MPTLVFHTPEELGSYYDIFLKMAFATAIVIEECQSLEWFRDLEWFCFKHSIGPGLTIDVLSFVEMFYHGLAACDLELHMIIRNIMFLF